MRTALKVVVPGLLSRVSGGPREYDAGSGSLTPTLGAELFTDGGLEVWTSATNLTNWNEQVAGTSTINQETTIVHGGSNAARFDVDASNSTAEISRGLIVAIGTWLRGAFWIRASQAGKSGAMAQSSVFPDGDVTVTPGTEWVQGVGTGRVTVANPLIFFKRISAAGASLYFDDVSVKAITLSSMLDPVDVGFTPRVIEAALTRQPYTQIGYGLYVDANNWLIPHLNGAGRVLLLKRVAGTYADVQSASITYSAGAVLRMEYDPDAATVTVKYNGATVINAASVTDAVFKTATMITPLSTHESNSWANARAYESAAA